LTRSRAQFLVLARKIDVATRRARVPHAVSFANAMRVPSSPRRAVVRRREPPWKCEPRTLDGHRKRVPRGISRRRTIFPQNARIRGSNRENDAAMVACSSPARVSASDLERFRVDDGCERCDRRFDTRTSKPAVRIISEAMRSGR
jgi:hypothetical protein